MTFTRFKLTVSVAFLSSLTSVCQTGLEPLKYGDFSNWVTRNITESVVIGGKSRRVYAIAPSKQIDGNIPYVNSSDSPWATSNVYAKVSGVTKASNAVYPSERTPGDMCAKLCTQMEKVKVLGLINMNVMVAGSIFLGKMLEPISSTSNPYRKMEMGVHYTKRPSALSFDYKLDMPIDDIRIKSTGLGGRKVINGRDSAVAFVLLQRRWEDSDGNIHAARVGTGGELFRKGCEWQNGHRIPIKYGDVSADPKLRWLGLRDGRNAYYARNSKGKMVPVHEECWDESDATPTHVVLMISSGNGEPFVGTEGLTFYVDNVSFCH